MPLDPNLRARFFKPPKSGDDLRAAFVNPPPPRAAVVEEFLYRRKLTYIIADPGTGKSTIATQLACSVAGAVPVFGLFNVPKPLRVYYAAFETEWDEFQESCAMIRKQFAYDEDLIRFDEEMLGVNVLDQDHAQLFAGKIHAQKPGLIILDPLYLLVAGDVKEGVVASSVARWMATLAVQCECPVLALHHTHKERQDKDGKEVKERDRSYGSRWLKASATLWWQMTESAGGDGVVLENLKDRYKLSRRKISLKYDPSTRCAMGQTGGRQYLVERISEFINQHSEGTELTFTEIAEHVDCSANYVYELTKTDLLRGRLERHQKEDRTVVWRVKKPMGVAA